MLLYVAGTLLRRSDHPDNCPYPVPTYRYMTTMLLLRWSKIEKKPLA